MQAIGAVNWPPSEKAPPQRGCVETNS